MSRDEGSDQSDRSLLGKAMAGDQRAWDVLVARHNRLLWRIARRDGCSPQEAQDTVQITWLRLLENASAIRNPDALRGWLIRTLRRENIRIRSGRVDEPLEDERNY